MVKYSPATTRDVRDVGSTPGLRKSPGGGHGNLIQYSCLENPHGQRNPAGYSLWGHKKLDMTERLSTIINNHVLITFITVYCYNCSIFYY